ncbi:6-phosphofructokinase [Bacillus weihaiensis]|uniref:6-phosphofructokinase n=1 Tax=Bacillus weihaiensis TaxID=1547283 RepID=A0A1L3MN43_9BACI|nr:6-phosphofructokinase [Bacillus weihaiensis]APH03731.1 hypothetical protein A9C19_02560 [Bacillus weihaiensis]
MKIGVVHFGCALEGTTQIVRGLIHALSPNDDVTLVGIEWDDNSQGIRLKQISHLDLHPLIGTKDLVRAFPLKIWEEYESSIANELLGVDKVILLGVSPLSDHSHTSRFLHVPISIQNDVKESQYTLGFDTALNAIVKNVELVRDTASSLSYGKVRVFNVQIPGTFPSRLLLHAAGAVEAEVIWDQTNEVIEKLKRHIEEKQDKQEGYTFFMMNESIDLGALEPHFKDYDVDWKIVVIDESQCGGPFPTALDRLIANKLKKAVIEWIQHDQPSGQLVFDGEKVLFVTSML